LYSTLHKIGSRISGKGSFKGFLRTLQRGTRKVSQEKNLVAIHEKPFQNGSDRNLLVSVLFPFEIARKIYI
jgi:hypothetical protein